ncbi:MAG: PAS domain-containing protein [Pontiellaceae bacterium]|nr:PAS domain-containing protein [Pontiellaceae bacterium]
MYVDHYDSGQYLANLMENLPEAVYFKDTRSRFLLANRSFCKRVGMTMKQLLGKTDFDLYLPPHALSAYDCEQKIINTGQPIVGLEEEEFWPDGRITWVSTTKVPFLDKDGEIIGTFGISVDITERKKLEHELITARKLESMGQLAAGIAHEINTPIQYVSDNLRFLNSSISDLLQIAEISQSLVQHLSTSGMADDEMVQKLEKKLDEADVAYLNEELVLAVKQSLEGTGRVSTIVRAMKEFAHPGSKEMVASDLNEAIRTTVEVTKNEWKYVSTIELDLLETLPMVPCFVDEINQVILNMIINARDAIEQTGEKGVIRISTAIDNSWVLIRISDTGGGIPPENIGSVFDPFFTTKEVGKGTGQGLYISYNVIVNKHKGRLTVFNSSSEGEGAVFDIRIPLVNSKPEV